jgi:predicted ATPase
MERYVLTGGPGSGKTSLLLALELLGECVTREGAEDYIRFQQARGIREPWREPDFQGQILRLCHQREQCVSEDVRRVFHDRGLVDGLAYQAPHTRLYREILHAALNTRYSGVFLIELPKEVERTEVRREDSKEALKLEQKLVSLYTELGYKVRRIGRGSVEERVKELLGYLETG